MVKEMLDILKVPYVVDPYIVRGLDYYIKTAFEATHPSLGAQDAIGGGGRYDDLARDIGGTKRCACGFALGEDRIIMALDKERAMAPALDMYIALLGDNACREGFRLCNDLRQSGISAEMDYEKRSLKAQMRQANKRGARYVSILGEDELEKKVVIVRNMSNGEQREVALDRYTDEVKKLFNKCK